MLENMKISKEDLVESLKNIIDKSLPLVSNLSNVSSLLMYCFDKTLWCGFYLSNIEKEYLFLGPFQGTIACTTIPYGKGVCGKAAQEKKTIVVENVHEFEGHIACSSKTNSEIVVPIIKDNIVYGVIDLDSEEFGNYKLFDKELLEEVAKILSELF